MMNWNLGKKVPLANRYSLLVALLFIIYSCYGIIDFVFVHNPVLNIALFIIVMPNLLVFTKANQRTFIVGTNGSTPNKLQRTARLWYLANLYLVLVISLANITAVLFLALQLFTLSTNAFHAEEKQTRYIQFASLVLTSVYVTAFLLQSTMPSRGVILLSFYASWLGLHLATYYERPL